MRTTVRLLFFCPKLYASLLCFIALGLILPQSTRAQMAGTYTINSAQATSGTNFQSFNEAITALKGGLNGAVTFNVAPGSGPYNERLFLDHTIATTATHTLTFNCNGVTLGFLSKDGEQKSGIMLDSIDYVTFDSLVVIPQGQEADEYGYGFHLLHDADHNTIRRCKIINNHNVYDPQRNDNIIINGIDGYAVDFGNSYCDSNLITNNVISGGFSGITISSDPADEQPESYTKGNRITNNIITDIENAGVLLNGHSIGTLIDGNEITAPNAMWTAGIRVYYFNESCIISNNRIHNIHNAYAIPVAGIELTATASAGKENIIANNLIYDIVSDEEQSGISVRYGSPASYVKILHNTILLDDQSATAFGTTYGINLGYNTSQVQVMNNIVSITRKTSSESYVVFVEAAVPGLICDYNNWHLVANAGNVNAIGALEWVPSATLADWRSATGNDLHSTSYDPLYTDAAGGNLYPAQGAMDNMGSFANINTDITGLARNNSTPDMGAYEFLSPPCTVPIAGTAFVSPANTVCEGSTVTLNLSGQSFGTGQTYQWQTDSDINGSFGTNVSSSLTTPSFDVQPTATLYYRAAVTCGASTVYTTPIQIFVDPALAAGTYTIDAAKPTAGDNFHSFADAINAMHCGVRGHVVFNVAAGTYSQQVMIPAIPRTSASSTVTFRGNNVNINFTSTNSDEKAIIKLNGADHVTIEGFNITVPGASAGDYGFGIQLINNARHNTIKKNTINLNKSSASMDFAGIVISPSPTSATGEFLVNDCDSNTISGNTVIGGYYGITCTSYDFAGFVNGNKIVNNTLTDNHGYGIYVSGTKKLLIEGNTISRPTRTISAAAFTGIYANTRNHDLTISKNRIHGLLDGNRTAANLLMGIGLNNSAAPGEAPNTVVNNLVNDFAGFGIQFGLYYFNSDNTRFYHNTVSLEDSTLLSYENTDYTRGFSVFGSSTNGLEFQNNNITIKRGGKGLQYCIYVVPAGTDYTSNNNNFLVKAGNQHYTGYRSGAEYSTLANWQSGSGQDAASIALDPEYKAPANGDYTPSAMAFENKGAYRNIDTDINNKQRSNLQPDIGAFEFFTCLAFPVVQAVNDSLTVCAGANIQFEVKDPDAGATYTWYNAVTGGDTMNTGTSYAVNNMGAPVVYWIEVMNADGCVSLERARVKAVSLAPLSQAPVITVDSAGVNTLRFKWTAIPGATAYQVSRDGVSFTMPSSGAGGLTHTITGLNASDSVAITVRSLAVLDCQQIVSQRVGGRTLTNQYFIPNTFTPNGNGQNDVFKVYSNVIQSMHLMVFNQWGEKVFETTNPQTGWDGMFKGKPQPVGVYVYVARLLLTGGISVNQKGTINLVR